MDIRTRWRALFVPRHVHHADGSETPAFYIAPAGRVLIGSIVLVVILLALWLAEADHMGSVARSDVHAAGGSIN